MAQTRKQKVLQEVKRQRQKRTITTIAVAAALITIIGVGVYALSRNAGNHGFPYPCLAESVNLHVHPWLRISINTTSSVQNVTIPAGVGILGPQYTTVAGAPFVSGGSCFEPLHTHDATGIIHVEAASVGTAYSLGDFFTIWQVTYGTVAFAQANRPVVFNQTDILGFRTGQGHTISLLVDGQNSTQYSSLDMTKLDYCSGASSVASVFPCYPSAGGDPQYGGNQYPYGTGHMIVIKYG